MIMGRRGDIPFRVLLVGGDEDRDVHDLLGRAGITGAQVLCFATVAPAVGALADHPADAILLRVTGHPDDWSGMVRLQAIAPGVPVLPFHGRPAPSFGGLAESSAPWSGATAETGPAEPGHGDLAYLVACLQRAFRKREADRRLLHVATHDRLTGLANRWLLEDRIKRALARARRQGSRGAVIFIDLDGFKQVNDQFGHETGDAVLATVGQRLARALRETDTVGRFGGDEFLAVLERVTDRPAAERLVMKVGRLIVAPIEAGSIELRIGASIGLAMFPEDGEDVATLLRCADQSMFRTKRASRIGTDREAATG